MTVLRNKLNLALAACLVAGGLLQSSAAFAYTPDQVRMVEREYARQTGGAAIPDAQLAYYLDRLDEGWTMARVSADIAGLRTPAARNAWRPAGGYVAREVICTSISNRYRECPAPWRGDAMLSQQLSNAACIEGRSWGQKPGAIWVNNGCRAVFTVVRGPMGRGNAGNGMNNGVGMVTCTSNQGRYRECTTGMRNPVTLVNQLPNSAACIERRTWGNKPGAVWVDRGCRAQFTTERRAERLGFTRDPNYGVTCASTSSGRTICNWDTRYGNPVIVRELSNAACVEGRGWGYDRNGELWVAAGCRARFGYGPAGATTDAWTRDPNYAVTCTSVDGRRTVCDWDRRYGQPVLIQQISSTACVEGRDWGYDVNGGLWVNSGCRARFGLR
jgi:hypothetical protein